MAAICWFSSSTRASASDEICFSLSRLVCSPLIVMLALSPLARCGFEQCERPSFLFFSAVKSSCSATSVASTSCFAPSQALGAV